MATTDDCSKCPVCVIQRSGDLLADANVQLVGISACQMWNPDRTTFQLGLERGTDLPEDQRHALCDLLAAFLQIRADDPTIPKNAKGWKSTMPRFILNVCFTVKTKRKVQMDVSFLARATPCVTAG
jgi:hypothetical protein